MISLSRKHLKDREFARRTMFISTMFANILPIYSEYQRATCRATLGSDIAIIIPQFFQDITRYAIKHPDSTKSYFKFLHEATGYALGYSDKRPEVQTSDLKVMEAELDRQIPGWRESEMMADVDHALSGWRFRDD